MIYHFSFTAPPLADHCYIIVNYVILLQNRWVGGSVQYFDSHI